MKTCTIFALFFFLFFSLNSFSAIQPSENLIKMFQTELTNPSEQKDLRKKVLEIGNKAVPVLTQVMKESQFPDKNRWLATFLLVNIMGEKASPFLSKFLEHPNWVLRMASLKGLLKLKEKKYAKEYSTLLRDGSLMVRLQALENIKNLNLTDLAPEVWKMLFREHNYQKDKNGSKKRMDIIKEVIRTTGDLNYQKAKGSLLTMIQKNKYADLLEDIDYSLTKITGKKSPDGPSANKKNFWSKFSLKEKVL